MHELEVTPWPLLVEILDFRAYAMTRDELERAEGQAQTLEGARYDRVREIQNRVRRVQLGFDPMPY